MTEVSFTRFDRTPSGYRRRDTYTLAHGPDLAATLNGAIEVLATGAANEPTAWSFSKFKAGKMSGETWVAATSVVLEFFVGSDPVARLDEIKNATSKLGYAHYLISTQTRKGQATFTVVFPLSEAISEKRYARIASVLATQMDVYHAAPGIQAYTHLIHVDHWSVMEYHGGLVINPDFFIKFTKSEAQNVSPTQFEQNTPAVQVQLEKPTLTACDDGLFEGL